MSTYYRTKQQTLLLLREKTAGGLDGYWMSNTTFYASCPHDEIRIYSLNREGVPKTVVLTPGETNVKITGSDIRLKIMKIENVTIDYNPN